MDLQKLLELLKDNEEAVNFVSGLTQTTESLTKKINALEGDAKKAFETRDSTKQKAKKLLDKLGLDDLDNIDDDLLDKVLKGKGSDAEVQNLKNQLEKAVAEKSEIENSYKGKLSSYALKTELNKTGLAQKALNAEVYAILENIALAGAIYTDDGKVIFKNEDGSTKYSNGKEYTLNDRVAELSASASYAPLFKVEGKGGTGTNPQQKTGGTQSTTVTGVDKMKLARQK